MIETNEAINVTKIDFELQFDVMELERILKDTEIDITTEEGQNKLEEWSGKEVKATEILEMPKRIYLYEDEQICYRNAGSHEAFV